MVVHNSTAGSLYPSLTAECVLLYELLMCLGHNSLEQIQHALYGLAQLCLAVYGRYSTHTSPQNLGHLFATDSCSFLKVLTLLQKPCNKCCQHYVHLHYVVGSFFISLLFCCEEGIMCTQE